MSESYVAALLAEREGMVRAGKVARVAAIDAELARFNIGVDDDPTALEQAVADPAADVETTDAAPRARRRS